jgi:hypothetical protein
MMTTQTEFSAVDLEALTRSFDLGCRESTAYCLHLTAIEKQRGWRFAAESASYHFQIRTLKLRPWQPPPPWVRDIEGTLEAGDDEIGGWYQAAQLAQRLRENGLSLFEPDPPTALAIAEGKRNVA